MRRAASFCSVMRFFSQKGALMTDTRDTDRRLSVDPAVNFEQRKTQEQDEAGLRRSIPGTPTSEEQAVRTKSTIADRRAAFERTSKIAKDAIDREQRLRREKNERLRQARLQAEQQGRQL